MTPIDLNVLLFIITVFTFAWIGFRSSRQASTANDYFHESNFRKNILSLTASNITLGTGLVYLISGAHKNGLLMLLPVVCVGIGYWLLGEFLDRVASVAARTKKNFLAGIDEEISLSIGHRSWFAKTVSFSLVVVFVLLLAFEIFASARVMTPFVTTIPSGSSEAMLSIIIFLITVTYAVLGGAKALFGVDVIQIPLIALFLPTFIIAMIPNWSAPASVLTVLHSTLKIDTPVLVAIGIACINSIATQFYSILNWGSISNVEVKRQRGLLRWVGALTSIVLSLFVCVGLLFPADPTSDIWTEMLRHINEIVSAGTAKSFIISSIMTLGMASILLTTTDAIVVYCILFWHDNLHGGDSRSGSTDKASLGKIRLIGFATFGICFIILCALNYLQPDPFYLLLSMAGGVVVFAPMIVCAGFLSSQANGLKVFSNKIVAIYIGIFAISGMIDVVLLYLHSSLIAYIGLASFIASLFLSLVLWAKGKGVATNRVIM